MSRNLAVNLCRLPLVEQQLRASALRRLMNLDLRINFRLFFPCERNDYHADLVQRNRTTNTVACVVDISIDSLRIL